MQGDEGFAQLANIADHLGAALGGSLPAVDAGWVPVARQIGQSGKFVGPRTYFAVGISGTPQHLAGVSRECRVIAVNKDALAPIFDIAEIGVVAEWQVLLPALARELAALRPIDADSPSSA
jgi:electron transfer flavoprotein alpha subunit